MSFRHQNGRPASSLNPRRHRQGSAKPLIIISLVVLIGVLVPLAVYIIANVAFPNGATGTNLTVPDTGVKIAAPRAAETPPAANNNNTNNKTAGRMMELLVVDHDTKQPVSGIRVQSYWRSSFSGNTGADGLARVPIPTGDANNFSVRVSGKAYVPKRLQWASYRPEFQGEVPTSCTIEMEHTTKISGKIVDDDGQPIAGAFVYVDFTQKYPNSHEQIDLSPYNQSRQIISAQDGSWSYTGAPQNCNQIGLTAWDTKHVTGDYWIPQPFSPVSKLYDGSATFTLRRGLTVDGTVLDPQGAPMADASVALGQQRGSVNAIPARNTDSNGHFSYQFDPGAQVILTIQARGCAPEMRDFTMGQEKKSLTIQLSKPHRISGKVVDAHGKPVRNASVYFQTWRGYRTIDANFQTDGGGNFHWNDAPADPITVSINARGVRGVENQTLNPDQENVVTLGSISHIRGTVTDGQTGKPIENFRITMGILWNVGQPVTWQPGWTPDRGNPAGGKFDITNNYSYPGMAVRIAAPGYMPVESRIVKPDEGDATLDLKMKPAKDIVLTIRTPDRKPVAGATAVMAIPGQQVRILNGREVQYSQLPQQTSGPDGRVDFSPQPGNFAVVIFADAGSAEVDQNAIAKSADVTLTPWGKIQGRMMVGSKPAAEQNVDVMPVQTAPYEPTQPRIFYQNTGATDKDGRFVFDHLSPGTWNISHRINVFNNSWSDSALQIVQVSAGQTVTINVGGMGRPVVGKVVLPPQISSRSDWSYMFCNMSTHMDNTFPPPPVPDDIRNGTREAQQKWFQNWSKTDAAKAFMEAQQKAMAGRRNYSFSVAPDGTFRIEDVLAGTYDVSITLRSSTGQNGIGDPIGMGSATIVVPEMPGGRSDDPLQMDPIPVVAQGKYHVGDLVYDLAMKSAAGKAIQLSDFRGKYVLLDFRMASNDPGVSALKAVHDAYSQDKRFVLLTLDLNYGPWQSTKLPGIAWQQATIDRRDLNWSIIGTNFALANNSPVDWLINPEGKVAAENLHGAAIMSAIAAALGPPTTQPTTAP